MVTQKNESISTWKQMPDPGNKYSWKCPTNSRGGGGGGTHGIDWNIVRQSLYVDETSQQASS
jgi:hypothetical protein